MFWLTAQYMEHGGGVFHRCTARLTRWRTWPVPFTTWLLAVGGAFPALCAVAKISIHLVGYLSLAGLIVVALYIGGAADTRAAGLAEAHAEVMVGVLKKVDDGATTSSTLSTSSISLCSGVVWALAEVRQASSRQEENGDEFDEDEESHMCIYDVMCIITVHMISYVCCMSVYDFLDNILTDSARFKWNPGFECGPCPRAS